MKIQNTSILLLSLLFSLSALRAEQPGDVGLRNGIDRYGNGPIIDSSTLSDGPETCSLFNQDEENPTVVITLDQNDNGHAFFIPSGALVKVILQTSSGTGSDWTYASSSPDVLNYISNYKIDTNDKSRNRMGAPVQKCWEFRAMTSGQTMLTFALARSYNKDATPLETVQFDITVE